MEAVRSLLAKAGGVIRQGVPGPGWPSVQGPLHEILQFVATALREQARGGGCRYPRVRSCSTSSFASPAGGEFAPIWLSLHAPCPYALFFRDFVS